MQRGGNRLSNKKVRLNYDRLSKETIGAIASNTLRAGGCVEASPREPQIGDKMPDGTVLAGVSPHTNKPMYVAPTDVSLTMTFDAATEYAIELDAHGHRDWRLPTKAELNVLFNNQAALGGFDVSGSAPGGRYWSSSQDNCWGAWGQRFRDGTQYYFTKEVQCSIRPVR